MEGLGVGRSLRPHKTSMWPAIQKVSELPCLNNVIKGFYLVGLMNETMSH